MMMDELEPLDGSAWFLDGVVKVKSLCSADVCFVATLGICREPGSPDEIVTELFLMIGIVTIRDDC